MSLKVGEVGKIIRVATSFVMSGNTELKIVFTKPDGTAIEKTKSGNGVTAPTVAVTDPLLGPLAASTYLEYPVEAGVFDVKGTYTGYAVYIDGTPKEFCGDKFSIAVEDC